MRLQSIGKSHLGLTNADGIRYVWQIASQSPYIESAAFKSRAKILTSPVDEQIAAYTTSVSSGCALTAARMPCKFCRTGNTLRFSGPLSAQEIALQNVFMVLSDMEECASDASNIQMREFAYMGQGEPGYSYPQLRQAIKITDKSMESLHQRVFRHILATSGVVEMVDAFIDDLEGNFFNSTRVTFHYSLHATQERSSVMPIESIYCHRDVVKRLPRIQELTGEKPCVGVLLFKNYRYAQNGKSYSTDAQEIERIVDLLDPSVCRISLCEFNPCDSVGTNEQVTPQEADFLVKLLQDKGFQVKLFASFGQKENTACGLLGGTAPDMLLDSKMKERYARAIAIVRKHSVP